MSEKVIAPKEFHCEFNDGHKTFARRILNFLPRVDDKVTIGEFLYSVIAVGYDLNRPGDAIAAFIIVRKSET